MKDFSFKDLERAGAEAARKSAKEAGTFISYGNDGKVIREYPDGRINRITIIHMLNEQPNMRIMSFVIRKSRNSRRISRCCVLTIKSFYT
ncbi:hypothetical protein ABIE48_003051 [Paenibacillus sp. OAE614]